MPQQHRNDPYLNFNFRVEIDNLPVAGFSEAELPEGRIEVIEYREGADTSTATAPARRAASSTARSSCAAASRANRPSSGGGTRSCRET